MNTDTTYCASPKCRNECGRKPPKELLAKDMDLWWAYFCGEPIPESKL